MSKRRCGTCDATGIGFDGANCFDCGGSGAQMSCDLKLAQTHIANAIDEAKRLTEGENDADS